MAVNKAFKKSFNSLEQKQAKSFDNQEFKKTSTSVDVKLSVKASWYVWLIDQLTYVTHEFKKVYRGGTDGENWNSRKEHPTHGNYNFTVTLPQRKIWN